MARVLDLEQALLLLEIEAPFEKRDVQLARRRMAKRWHPDIAPPGRQHEHQRHLQAINEAADQLEQLAEGFRGGRVSRNAVKVSAAAARKARAEEGRRAYEAEQRAQANAEDRAKHDPFGSRVPDHSVVHRYARCLSYPEWGVGTVSGIYFSGDGDDVQQWARLMFSVGVRTVPAGSLQFVDFSRPDAAAERVQRFMTAAQHALAEGDAGLAAQRLVYARDADPANPVVLRLLTTAFWQAGNLNAAARTVRDWARLETDRPTPERFAARIYEDMGAIDLAAEAAQRAANRAPADASEWERLGRLRLRLMDRAAAISALEHAREVGPSVEGLLGLALAYHLTGDVGAEVSAAEAATRLDPESEPAWTSFAHALARTDRVSECLDACRQALRLGAGEEVADLLATRGGGPAARARGPQRRLSGGRRPRADRGATPRAPARRGAQRQPCETEPSRPHTGQDSWGPRGRPPQPGQSSTRSSTPSSSPTRQTSSRSSSTSTQAPAAAGNTTWSPGRTGITTPTWSHQSRPGPTASTIPCWGGGSSLPGGHEQARAPDPVGIQLLDHHAVKQGSQHISHGS